MLRIAFAGTPEFAVPTLQSLIESPEIQVECVYTQPDRPSGRGQKLSESAVKRCATDAGLRVRQPLTLKTDEAIDEFRALNLDALVVVAYGQILKSPILEAPRLGCLNVHASLLPRWRGAAPLQRAIQAGDTETGLTIMLMDEGLDTGAMLARQTVPLTDRTTTAVLHDTLAALGGPLLLETLLGLARGSIQPEPQPDTGVTYAAKITTDEALIHWAQPGASIMRHIHAFNPVPGAFCYAGAERLKIFEVKRHEGPTLGPGVMMKTGCGQVVVGTQDTALEILSCQLPGGKRLSADAISTHQKGPWAAPMTLTSTSP